ncbi:Ig-like domain-containing protein, partial [Microbacterium sp. Bi128]
YNATTRVLTINPSATLLASTQYRVIITGGTTRIRDLAGNPLPSRSWTFTTGTAL